METTTRKIFDLEFLRAYAIITTFIAHLNTLIPEWISWMGYFWLGIGVQLFFVISGFLMTRSLLENLQEKNSFRIFAGSFWIRRIFRLWPAAFVAATTTFIISALFDVTASFESRSLVTQSWIFALLNLENFYIYACLKFDTACKQTPLWHYWSLSLEEQFYFILPFCLFFFRKRKHLIWVFLIAAFMQAVTIRPTGSFLWFIRSEALLYGGVIALLWHYYPQKIMALSGKISQRKGQALAFFLCILLLIASRKEITPYYMGAVDVVAALIVLMASCNRDFFKVRCLPPGLMLYIGARSYSLYLWHMPVFAILRSMALQSGWLDLKNGIDSIIAAAICLALTMLLAEISYRWIETPWRIYGRAYSDKIRQTA